MDTGKPLSRRSFLALAATSLGGLAVAACGATPTATPTLVPKAAPPTIAPTPAPKAAVEIQFRPILNWATNGADIWRQEVANITAKRPYLKIVSTGATNSDADEQQLITTMAAGTGPDVWCHGGSSGGYWGAKGVAAPLDDYLKKSPMAGDYFDAGLMPHSWGGKLYAIGLYIGPNMTQWRKDIFKEVGLDPEKGPNSWEELGQMGQKLAVWKGEDITRVGFNIPATGLANQAFYFGLYMHTAGGAWFTDDFKKTRVNEQAGVDALQFVVDLYWKYKANATYAIQASTPGVPLIVTGQVAMDWINFVSYVYAKANKPDLLANWGMLPIFTGPKSKGGIIFVNTVLMNAKSKVKDACWEMIEEMSTLESLEYLSPAHGGLIPRKSWYDKNPDKVKADPMISNGLQAVNNAYPIHWGPDWLQFRIALIPFLTEACLRKRTPKEALDAAAAKLNTEVLGST